MDSLSIECRTVCHDYPKQKYCGKGKSICVSLTRAFLDYPKQNYCSKGKSMLLYVANIMILHLLLAKYNNIM